MSLVGFKARNHPQQSRNPKVDDRQTPPEVFDPLDKRFGFTLDVAASDTNAKLPNYFTAKQDGLAQSWAHERVWCNPPYSDIRPWVEKAWHEAGIADVIVMLVPANRTEQGWWQDLVEPHRDMLRVPAGVATSYAPTFLRVEFLRGRLRFIAHDAAGIKPNERPPFGCCLLIWGGV